MRIVEMVRNDIKNSSLLKTKFLIYAFNGRTEKMASPFKGEKMEGWKDGRLKGCWTMNSLGLTQMGHKHIRSLFPKKGTLNIRKLLACRLLPQHQRKIIVTFCFSTFIAKQNCFWKIVVSN